MSTQTESQADTSGQSQLAGKYLSFKLSKEEYGIHILKVREIIGIVDITPLPSMSNHVKGVINLRGKIIPVLDLRPKFGMPEIEYTAETCIIVVDLERDGEPASQMGCIVDTVNEVLNIEPDAVELAPRCAKIQADFLLGLGKLKEMVLILLDIDKIMTSVEIDQLDEQLATVQSAAV